ncbi:Hint domain-containing protein [Corallococcus terminator]|uniref:Cell surface protein n=1 Tax=Corallococcus terminator TaxID=2316733 RepID=A0A3A8HMF1_9BACT|nr:Hint domain-containing protein [Corallococcus terminator]RKG72479.1 cell surface protein [Corallococcus terminator]
MSKSVFRIVLGGAAAIALFPTVAGAQTQQEWRCNIDSLVPSQAIVRAEWARKCGLLNNLVPAGPSAWVPSTTTFDLAFAPAKEYVESNTSRAYTGNSQGYKVNYYYAIAMYDATPILKVEAEAAGPTMGFFKWNPAPSTILRARPLYPTFETSLPAGSGTPLYPHPTDTTDCRFYRDTNMDAKGDTLYTGTSFYVVANCESSCYAPDQELLFSNGSVPISKAVREQQTDILTLTPDATLDDVQLQTNHVYSYTSETRDSEHLLYTITTEHGGKLRLTNEHPVVNSEGRMVRAADLKVDDELLRQDGTRERVVSVEKTTHFGKVYNLRPITRDQVTNVLVAQGFLVGSARYQNEDVGFMNRIILQRSVPEELLPQ